MKIDVDIEGDRQARLLFDEMQFKVKNPREYFLNHAGPILFKSEERAFASQGASQGIPWKAHRPTTVQRMGSHRVLDDTGRLKRSLVRYGASDQKFKIQGDALYFGSTVYYAKWQAPQRPFMRLNIFDVKKLEDALLDYIVPA